MGMANMTPKEMDREFGIRSWVNFLAKLQKDGIKDHE